MRAGVEQATVLVGDGHAGRFEAMNGRGHHVDDGVHLSLPQCRPFQVEHHGGTGFAFVAGEDVVFGDSQQHLGLGHILELLDGACQLALAAQLEALALHPLADPETGIFQQDIFTTDAGIGGIGETGTGQGQLDSGVIFGVDQHALAIHLIGDLLLIEEVEGLDQLLGGVGAEGTHVRLLAPQQDKHRDGQTDGKPQDQGDLSQYIGIGQESQRRTLLLIFIEGGGALIVYQQIAVLVSSHDLCPYC